MSRKTVKRKSASSTAIFDAAAAALDQLQTTRSGRSGPSLWHSFFILRKMGALESRSWHCSVIKKRW